MGKQSSLIDQFLLLGFGTTSSELRAGYDIKYAGEGTAGGQACARLELTPKSAEPAIMWQGSLCRFLRRRAAGTASGVPAVERLPLITYTNVALNPSSWARCGQPETAQGR